MDRKLEGIGAKSETKGKVTMRKIFSGPELAYGQEIVRNWR